MTSPAMTIVFIVPPRRYRITAAASSDNGMADRLMTAVRQS